MMRLLLIDTCGAEASVALAEGGNPARVIASEVLPGRSASERLIPAIRGLMEAEGWSLKELTAIGVVRGPGSFTGVRVGLSAAKGLCEAGQIRMVAISRLAVLAASGQAAGMVCAALDAGRGEYYCGMYEGRHRVSESLLNASEVAVAAANAERFTVCESQVADALGSLGPQLVVEPKASDALPLFVERVLASEFDDVAELDANYLRRTDLEIFAKQAKLTNPEASQ